MAVSQAAAKTTPAISGPGVSRRREAPMIPAPTMTAKASNVARGVTNGRAMPIAIAGSERPM
jgi:hypothetical protein